MKKSSKLSEKKILLVEDAVDSARFMIIFLEKAGASVEWFENAVKACHHIEKNSPHYDIILSDINLPEMNGHEFCERIKQLDRYKKTPCIALSGGADKDGKSLKAGFDSHLVKPVKPSKLVAFLEEITN